MEPTTTAKRVLLLMTPATYRAGAFLAAAAAAEVEVVQGVDLPPALAEAWHAPLAVDFSQPERAAEAIAAFAQAQPLAAVLSVDDSASLVAALASAKLGLPHNRPEAALAARDKGVMRQALADGGVRCPTFRRFARASAPEDVAAQVSYPCVVKPLRLNGSRGVMRADTPAQCIAAFTRLRRLLEAEGDAPGADEILVEDYIPGVEVALEGILAAGHLHVLALFDKPDPLEGPFFEETIYVTPSRLGEAQRKEIENCAVDAVRALG
ncbi:MAG TPA: ATP-grasp domain-containing protein, partial [Ktedonobacterales bacterium]|nr:ATP-grasp domain-containing protein [Ktedonobacterales bacterium]